MRIYYGSGVNQEWHEWYERINAMDRGSLDAARRLPDLNWRIWTIQDYLNRKAWRERWQKSAHRTKWEASKFKVFWGDYEIARDYQIQYHLDYWE